MEFKLVVRDARKNIQQKIKEELTNTGKFLCFKQ